MGSAAWGGSVYDGVEDIVEDMEAGGFLEALVRSWSMILVSEMGDETFIIAAILAMRHPRSIRSTRKNKTVHRAYGGHHALVREGG